MLDGITIAIADGAEGLRARIRPAPPLPLLRLLSDRPAEEAADLLPRLFNLCREAQGAAARLALCLAPASDAEALRQEVLRDHLLKLLLTWPRLIGLPPRPLPRPAETAAALFGPAGRLPDSPEALDRWIAEGAGAAPLIAALRDAFAPGEAIADQPFVSDDTVLANAPVENSPAARHPDHPLLDAIAQSHGNGPLWRALARLTDAEAVLAGALPAPRRLPDGTALAPAARGLYALRLTTDGDRITAITRRTPTDHMLTPGGMLEQTFATLPRAKRALAPLVLDLLDPCVACELTEAEDA